MTDVKYGWIYKKCLELIVDFENRNSTKPKYILLSRNTFVQLCAYLNKFDKLHQEKFLPSRDIYFYGVNLRLADIEDDEVIVGG